MHRHLLAEGARGAAGLGALSRGSEKSVAIKVPFKVTCEGIERAFDPVQMTGLARDNTELRQKPPPEAVGAEKAVQIGPEHFSIG